MSYDADSRQLTGSAGTTAPRSSRAPSAPASICLATFSPTEIQDWIEDDEADVGQTALCPRCGIDSVIGSKSGISLDVAFLSRMHAYWFGRTLSGAEAEAELARRRRLQE